MQLKLQMADYLLAESKATLEDKHSIFALWTDINDLSCKYGCQEDMSNFHIFISQDPQDGAFKMLMNGNI